MSDHLVAGSVSSSQVGGNHHWLLSVAIGIGFAFVVSVMLLACWVHWYRSRILLPSYGTPKFTIYAFRTLNLCNRWNLRILCYFELQCSKIMILKSVI